jgi:beta-xylosidase
VVTFRDFRNTQETFNISAAVGLSGYFNITFTKAEGLINFYNDIQFITINVYIPIESYSIKLTPFSAKSVGYPIKAIFTL